MTRQATLTTIGAALVIAGAYESISDRIHKPSLTQVGQRHPELAGALVGALTAHFFAPR